MLVSTLRPYSTAVTLDPLPRWQETMRSIWGSVPRCAATAAVT
jgi:hypothetical protein